MAVRVKNLKGVQNEDFSYTAGFATQDPSGNLQLATAVSFAGMTAKLQMRQNQLATSALIMTLATGSGITLGSATYQAIPFGTIAIVVPNATTANLPPGQWFYDCFLYSGSLQKCWLAGWWEWAPSVTR